MCKTMSKDIFLWVGKKSIFEKKLFLDIFSIFFLLLFFFFNARCWHNLILSKFEKCLKKNEKRDIGRIYFFLCNFHAKRLFFEKVRAYFAKKFFFSFLKTTENFIFFGYSKMWVVIYGTSSGVFEKLVYVRYIMPYIQPRPSKQLRV